MHPKTDQSSQAAPGPFGSFPAFARRKGACIPEFGRDLWNSFMEKCTPCHWSHRMTQDLSPKEIQLLVEERALAIAKAAELPAVKAEEKLDPWFVIDRLRATASAMPISS